MNAGQGRPQYRVNGNLNLCRALGDFEYKKNTEMGPEDQIITSCPDIYIWDECDKDDFLILACDGIFDVLSNEEVAEFVRVRLDSKDLGTICEECMDHCLSKNPKETHGIGA
eukprot:UN27502